jgi:hypothetical protein
MTHRSDQVMAASWQRLQNIRDDPKKAVQAQLLEAIMESTSLQIDLLRRFGNLLVWARSGNPL